MEGSKKIIKISALIMAILAQHDVYAGAFSLYTEASPAAVGNFAAGIAAEAADASIGWYNPAGLVLLKDEQVVLGGVGVLPHSPISGTSTYLTNNILTPGGPPYSYTQTFTGVNGAKNAVVPALHYAKPLGENSTFGLSIVAPFGLSTDYGLNSPVRYAATLTKLETITVSPELGGRLTDVFSIGAGLDLQYAKVKFNQMLGTPAVLSVFELDPTFLDSESYNTGNSFGVGLHAGVLAAFNEKHSRIGLNYQSRIWHEFMGYSVLSGPLASRFNILAPNTSDPAASYRSNILQSNGMYLPDIITLSGYQDINSHWSVLGSVVYTHWSLFKEITLNNVAAAGVIPTGLPGAGTVIQTITNTSANQNYRNTWRFAVGGNYKFDEQWMLRLGAGYDQTPTINLERDVRLPDANRYALSIGGHYQIRPALGIDVGYSYLFPSQDPTINKTQAIGTTNTYQVIAKSDVHAQLVGVQVVWRPDQKQATK